MEFKLLYLHWLVLGMVFIIAEIFLPSFTISQNSKVIIMPADIPAAVRGIMSVVGK